MTTSFGLPLATMSTIIISGINFYHNNVQEDVLREHKLVLDGLRSDLDALNIPESSTAAVAALTGNKHAKQFLILKYKVVKDSQKIFLIYQNIFRY